MFSQNRKENAAWSSAHQVFCGSVFKDGVPVQKPAPADRGVSKALILDGGL